MQLFINSGICLRKWNDVKIKSTSSGNLILSIPNCLEKQSICEPINFIFSNLDNIDLECFNNDLLLDNISLVRRTKNVYHIYQNRNFSNNNMYALIRSTAVPDDVFIPAALKTRIKVLRRIRFVELDESSNEFLSNVYLIKIHLSTGESLPIYITSANPLCLISHYVFYRDDLEDSKYFVIKQLKTYIRLSNNNKNDYVSLSSLCE